MTAEHPEPEQPTRRSRRGLSARPADTAATAPEESIAANAETAGAAETPDEVSLHTDTVSAPPLTRRQLREMAKSGQAMPADDVAISAAMQAEPTQAPASEEPTWDEQVWFAAPQASEVPAFESIDVPPVESVEMDEFEAAARLFSFTGETPIQVAAAAMAEPENDGPAHAEATQPRRRWGFRSSAFKRATTASLSVGIVGVVGLLAVGMTTPMQAVAAATGAETATTSIALAGDVAATDEEIQAYVAPEGVESVALERSDYSTETMASVASDTGVTQYSDFYTNDPNAAIQWPFAVGVGISYGFGWRSGEFHEGADFIPGEGAHVQAIAAGTVRIATEAGGAYGVTVVIDHIIDGELISTRYAHMEYGSLQVSVGDTVEAGTFIGQTGDTGYSFGAHTHVEVLQDGTTPIDPIAWLRANAGRMSLDSTDDSE